MEELTRKKRLEIYKDIRESLNYYIKCDTGWCYPGFCDFLKDIDMNIKQLPELFQKKPEQIQGDRICYWFYQRSVKPRLNLINEIIEEMEACDTVRTQLMDNLRKVGFSANEYAEAMRECGKLTDPNYTRKKEMEWLKENFTETECEIEYLIDERTKISAMTREDIMDGLKEIRKGETEKSSLLVFLYNLEKEMRGNAIDASEAGRRIRRVLEKKGKDPQQPYFIRVEKDGEEIYTQRVDFNPTVKIQEMLNK